METKLEEKYIGIKPGGRNRFESSNLGMIFYKGLDGIYTSNCGRIRVTEDQIRHDLKMGFIKSFKDVDAKDVSDEFIYYPEDVPMKITTPPGSDWDTDRIIEELNKQPMCIVKSETSLKEAVEVLCKALKEDEDYYRSWSANIAMAFKDEYIKAYDKSPLTWETDLDLHVVANNAADNFLKQLINK